MARGNSRSRKTPSEAEEILNTFVVDRVTEKLNEQAEKLSRKAEKYADKMEALGPALELWMRREPGARKPRFSRDDIAEAAVRIADEEGIEALSMRRLATELGAGTMTLYHYVRTKDELLSLLTDAVMSELILPPSKLRGSWRDAITAIAHSSRAALERHPWIFDIVDDPAVGPNGVRHFDQSWQAVSSLPGTFEQKLDVIHMVDEYVFGYVLHARNDFAANDAEDPMRDYVAHLVSGGSYPSLAALIDEFGINALWRKMSSQARDPRRFDRNLSRLLDGVERSLR